MKVRRLGRRRWKKKSGYHRQCTIENATLHYKSMLSGRLHARNLGAQEVEVAMGCKVLNAMMALGRPESVVAAR